MKKTFFLLRTCAIPFSAFILSTFVLNSCKKTVDTGMQAPVSGLMAFNLVPDKASIGVAVSGQSLTNFPLLYTSYTGGYLGIFSGNRQVTSFDFNSGTTLATTTQNFADSGRYSVFALGANGVYRNVVVNDNLDSLPSTTGEAFVRYVNGIADSTMQPMVTISSGATDVFNTNAPFATVSGFKSVTPGDVSINVTNEAAINASRTITLEKDKIYTILLTGLPNQTDSTKAVQIKFIQNGAVMTTP
jgi:Domain of unknown function (DUF4397)